MDNPNINDTEGVEVINMPGGDNTAGEGVNDFVKNWEQPIAPAVPPQVEHVIPDNTGDSEPGEATVTPEINIPDEPPTIGPDIPGKLADMGGEAIVMAEDTVTQMMLSWKLGHPPERYGFTPKEVKTGTAAWNEYLRQKNMKLTPEQKLLMNHFTTFGRITMLAIEDAAEMKKKKKAAKKMADPVYEQEVKQTVTELQHTDTPKERTNYKIHSNGAYHTDENNVYTPIKKAKLFVNKEDPKEVAKVIAANGWSKARKILELPDNYREQNNI